MDTELKIALYQAVNDNDQQRPIDHWHCSSIAKCPRSLFYERKGITPTAEEPGAGKKLRWRAGHAIETAIRPELQKLFPKLETNIRFTNEDLDLSGEFDAYDPETKTLISVKSVHDYAMVTKDGVVGLKEEIGKEISSRTGKEIIKWGLKAEPYIHHQWQEHAYVLMGEWQVEYISYVYITLSGLMACYTMPVNMHILQRVGDKVTYLNTYWEQNKLPVCLCQPDQEMYAVTDQYCNYKTDDGCCSEALYA